MKISLIAAMDEKRGIGKDNKLPWQIPEDLERFRKLTSGHIVVMGRKTFESIGRVLPNRRNIIITHNESFKIEGVKTVRSLEEAIKVALRQAQDEEEIFIIGGGQIYQQAIGAADKLYLTLIEGDFECDTFFPEYQADFKKVVYEKVGHYGQYKYKFVELEKE